MERLFNNRFVDGISKLADIMLICIYFLVCSLPIVTIGASATALYYATHKCIYKGRGYTLDFFHSFKDNFKQSTLSWLIFIVILASFLATSTSLKTSFQPTAHLLQHTYSSQYFCFSQLFGPSTTLLTSLALKTALRHLSRFQPYSCLQTLAGHF